MQNQYINLTQPNAEKPPGTKKLNLHHLDANEP